MKLLCFVCFFLFLFISIPTQGAEENTQKEPEPPRVGNFALPATQQPSPLFGFGGNILDENEVQLFFFADYFKGDELITSNCIPNVVYGITENLSIYCDFPFTPLLRNGPNRSRGIEDFFVQLEYAFYNHATFCYEDQATLIFNTSFPTGSARKNPPTGYGAPSFFLGGTYYRTLVKWVFFTEHGFLIPTAENGTSSGMQFLYQGGFARTFATPPGRIFAWMLEIDGQYSQENRFQGRVNRNSGGDFIYATPSLWMSSKNFLMQLGVSFPLTQHLFGNQRKVDYVLNFNIAWSFY